MGPNTSKAFLPPSPLHTSHTRGTMMGMGEALLESVLVMEEGLVERPFVRGYTLTSALSPKTSA